MPLDPVVKALLDQMEASGRPQTWEVTPAEARQNYLMLNRLAGEPQEVERVENRTIPGPGGEIPVRIYSPKLYDTPEKGKPLPVLVFYHGGGWVIGDLDSHDPVCRRLANRAGCLVVAVHYRLAPEHPYPAAVEDALAALDWVGKHAGEIGGDPSRLAVGGDSAGGNLAAIVAQLARDQKGPKLTFQLLIYPATDLPGQHPSHEENGEGLFLTRKHMEYFYNHYAGHITNPKIPRLAPLLTEDFRDLPPALVITAEFDPLRDEGRAYADKLKAAGVSVSYHNYEGMIHAFYQMPGLLKQAEEAIDESGAALRQAFGE